MTHSSRPAFLGYVIAIGAALLVAVLRYAVVDILGSSANYVLFTVPIVLAGWYNGLRPALVATFAGAVLGAALVTPTVGFAFNSPSDVIGVSLYLVCGIIISFLCGSLHMAKERIRRSQLALQHEAALREEAERRSLATLEHMGDAFHVLDASERFIYMNPATRQLLESQGVDPDAVLGMRIWDAFPDAAGTIAEAEVQRVLRDRVPTVFEFHYPPWQRWFVVRVFPGSDGGVSVHLTDTTDVHALQADVEASTALALDHLQKLEMLYDTAPVGMCEIDSQLRYVRINSALARMNGYPAAEHIGRTVGEMIPGLADSIEEEYRRILATGIPVFEKEVEGFTAADPLVKHHWLASWYPLRNSEGVVDGISVVAQDVTELKQAEASLRQSEMQLRLAVEAANHTAYEWDIVTGVVTRLGEVPPDAPLGAQYTFADLVETVHPDDRASMLGRIEATLRGETDLYISEHRSNENPARDWCWARVRGRVIRAPDGTPLMMIGVSIDITEHKRLEHALHDADRRKDDFLATLAHELRNPLAPIRNALHLLKTQTPVPKEMTRGRDVIDRQVSQMARLLDDLLDVSRISRGTMELRLDVVDLREVIERALETSHPLIDERGHQVRLEFAEDAPLLVDADVTRLAQVFSNLLNNAAKYMDNEGHITVHASRVGSDAVVTVRDTGMGIDEKSLVTVFEMFTRGEPAAHRSRDGLGIGLSLARSIVELHGGTVEAKSEGPGRGSEFTVRLPLHFATPREPVPVKVPEPAEAPVVPWRLVIADDLRDSADSLAELLRRHGHEVQTAYDGEEAVAATEQFRPEAVLLDIGMPKLDGYAACRKIRSTAWGRDIVIVALTGWGQMVDREQTAAAGFTRHLVKPVDYLTLLKVLNELRRSEPLTM